MATGSLSINSVSSTKVNISYSINFNSYYQSDTRKREETHSDKNIKWIFYIDGNQASSSSSSNSGSSISYTQSMNTTMTISGTFYYKYRFINYEWVPTGHQSNFTVFDYWDTEIIEYDGLYKYVYTPNGEAYRDDSGIMWYYYDLTRYEQEWVEQPWEETSGTVSTPLSFYPHPPEFYFVNCTSGQQWLVEKGINSLITNINTFATYATQWKRWKNQSSSVSSCPGFFSGEGKITATQMNLVHNYVGTKKSYSQGDKISADMFNSLTNIINT